MKKLSVKIIIKAVLLLVSLAIIIALFSYCFITPTFIYPYYLGIIITFFVVNIIWNYVNVSDKFSLLAYIKNVLLHANYGFLIPFLTFAVIASIAFLVLGIGDLNGNSMSRTGISFIISAIYMPILVIYTFLFLDGHYYAIADYLSDSSNEYDKRFPIKFIFSHISFYFLILSTIVGLSLFLNYDKIETIIGTASTIFIIFMIVFEMIYVSTSPFNRLTFSAKVKFTFGNGGEKFDVVDYGDGNYIVERHGFGGAAFLLVTLVLNIIKSPFGLLFETYKLIDTSIKIFKGKDVELNVGDVQFELAKAGNKRLLLPFFSMIFLVVQLLTYRLVYKIDNINFEIKNAQITTLSSKFDSFACEFEMVYEGSRKFKDLYIKVEPHLGTYNDDALRLGKSLKINEPGTYTIKLNIDHGTYYISSDSYILINVNTVEFDEYTYHFSDGEYSQSYSLGAYRIDKKIEEKYQEAIELFNSRDYENALVIFEEISTYKESSAYIEKCKKLINEDKYQLAITYLNAGDFDKAISIFEDIIDYKDSQTLIFECKYQKGLKFVKEDNLVEAYEIFLEIESYKDSTDYLELIRGNLNSLATSFALKGEYDEAINVLTLIYNSPDQSSLYKACLDAINGDYRSIVSELNLKEVVVYPELISLNDNAFDNCTNLERIILPNKLEEIGSYAFNNCKKLLDISLPSSVTKISDYAFNNCKSFREFTVPSNLTYLGLNILRGCSSLEKVSINLTDEFIFADLFSDSRYLWQSISWPTSLSLIDVTSGNTIPDGFFKYLPNTIKDITFSEDIIEIGKDGFAYSKIGLLFPDTLQIIGENGYSNMGLVDEIVTLPSTVKHIGERAFYNTYFKTITLPGSLEKIEKGAFGCDNPSHASLNKIYFNGNKDKWLSIIDEDWDFKMNEYYDVECFDAIYHHSAFDNETGWTEK